MMSERKIFFFFDSDDMFVLVNTLPESYTHGRTDFKIRYTLGTLQLLVTVAYHTSLERVAAFINNFKFINNNYIFTNLILY